MSFTLCTSGAIVIKAGKNVSSSAVSGAILEQFSDEAEGFINAVTRYDWVANYSKVGANYKPILADAVSALAGSYMVAYDMSGYTNRGEAEDVINILHDRASRAIAILKEDKHKTKMGATDT